MNGQTPWYAKADPGSIYPKKKGSTMNTLDYVRQLAQEEEDAGFHENARALRAVPGVIEACNGLVGALDAIRADLGTQYPALSYHYVLARAALSRVPE